MYQKRLKKVFSDINKIIDIIRFRVSLKFRKDIIVGKSTKIGKNSILRGNNKIGKSCLISADIGIYSYIGNNSNIYGSVGKFCSIGSDVKVIMGRHPTHTFVSTSPVFFSVLKQCGTTFVREQKYAESIFADTNDKYPVIIGNDVWIANSVMIVSGVTIGDGAVIAAGSVVTKDVPSYSIVGGVPAKVIRERFTHEQIDFLQKFKWWDRDVNWIKDKVDSFEDISGFMEENI